MNIVQRCPLTGYTINQSEGKIIATQGPSFNYEFLPIGKAEISIVALDLIKNTPDMKAMLAGLCRNAHEEGIALPMITTEFITIDIHNHSYPKTFREKANHLLKYLYNHGGRDLAEFDFSSTKDYPLVYATGAEEFNKIMKYLEGQNFINIRVERAMAGHTVNYHDVTMTNWGILEAEKELPKIPLITLVDQKIATGNAEIDKTINHAKDLFFKTPQTMDNMRSACEALSYILEPLRKECEVFFGSKDVNDFFQIINNFDIRHNKETTKKLTYPEQIEWVFYSLLNTINTYTKLKKNIHAL